MATGKEVEKLMAAAAHASSADQIAPEQQWASYPGTSPVPYSFLSSQFLVGVCSR